MARGCNRCGADPGAGRFCPYCGLPVTRVLVANEDPFVGRVIAGRYEVGELISVGGMGRVHRGVQQSLDRPVAIKFIHPHLLTSPDAVNRFMLEARAASRLHHPNVVSVIDFGRTQDADGADLFMVMELLSGSDLARVVEREGPLPFERSVEILRQALMALGSAHERGITHRDVKPENIVIERLHGDVDHVKVIDFGIANMTGNERITRMGQVMGTPMYMSPEQISGNGSAPSSDLYAVAVMLFELLTGRPPFDDASPHRIMDMHRNAPRPDPRKVAPAARIPDALAEVCIRGLDVSPARRFPDAASFAAAIVAAGPARGAASSLPPPSPRASRPPLGNMADAATLPGDSLAAIAAREDPHALPGRESEIEWATGALYASDGPRRIVWCGAPGSGRASVMHAVGAVVSKGGSRVASVRSEPAPWNEVGYGMLRRLVASLARLAPDDPTLVDGGAAGTDADAAALQVLFGSTRERSTAGRDRDAAVRALRWGLEREPDSDTLVLLEDIDCADRPSVSALRAALEYSPRAPWRVLMTAESPPAFADACRIVARPMGGLVGETATRLCRERSIPTASDSDTPLDALWFEHAAQFHRLEPRATIPHDLDALLTRRIHRLSPAERSLLEAVAVLGRAPVRIIARVADEAVDAPTLLEQLQSGRWVDARGDAWQPAHMLISRAALRLATAARRRVLHDRATTALAGQANAVEVRAYHALRAEPDLAALVLVEEAVRVREDRGDDEGAIEFLSHAVTTGRTQIASGETDAGVSTVVLFGRKLAAALARTGRIDEASRVAREALGSLRPDDPRRATLVEQLSGLARARPSAAARPSPVDRGADTSGARAAVGSAVPGAPPARPAAS